MLTQTQTQTQTHHWSQDALFYHIYPLGMCGAPARNDPSLPVCRRLDTVQQWIGHMKELGVNAVYIGPLFEAGTHGYDTIDYFKVDRRLGDNETLKKLVAAFHANGIRVILDAVLNHTGREFWAFKELLQNPHGSHYRHWFSGISFNHRSPYNDPFTYDSWNGCYDLVKLNLGNPEVKEHLFNAVSMWITEFGIDGLRLDAADCMDTGFLNALGRMCKALRPDFWLMGEAVHDNNYRRLTAHGGLDSVTNYECYKGLYSSHNDKNYFEIAYAFNRQFGATGLFRDIPMYNFVDNHDVDRVASVLRDPAHLFPLYALLFTMPGVPSIYYGSECAVEGRKHNGSDAALRPCIDIAALRNGDNPLLRAIKVFAAIRKSRAALRYGAYRQLHVAAEQFAFLRGSGGDAAIVAVNAARKPAPLRLPSPFDGGTTRLTDILNNNETFYVANGRIEIPALYPCWARILVPAG